MLKNHRGIFLTVILSKVLERLLLERAENVLENINSLQCGNKGKSLADIIFLINGLIDHALYLDRTIYMTSYDFATCFDSLWLEDCLLSLRKIGMSDRMLHLLYQLNKSATITVKTPFGDAASFTIENIVKQGTVWGSKMCCASTAEICDEDISGGATVGDLTIQSTVYVDDCNRFNFDIVETEKSHEKFINFANRKRSPLNADKCVILTINKKTHVNPPTLMIGDHIMEEVKVTKVLGDMFNNKGDNTDMVDKRSNASRGTTNEMLAMCNEVTLGCNRMEVLLLLYQSVFLQTMISNGQAWSHITDKDIEKLRISQLRCLKRMLKVPSSTPNAFVYMELGVLPIEYELHKKQLSYLHSVLNRPSSDPIHRMYDQQLLYSSEKNWANTIASIRITYGLPTNDNEVISMSKEVWKNVVRKAVTAHALKFLKEKCRSMSKTNRLQYGDVLQVQKYLITYSFDVACVIFKLRGRTTNCRSNRGNHGECRLCGSMEESQDHCINCPSTNSDNELLSLGVIYGDIEPNNETVLEIVSRFNSFIDAIEISK